MMRVIKTILGFLANPKPSAKNQAIVLARKAKAYEDSGDIDAAIDAYEQAITLYPHWPYWIHKRGLLNIQQGNLEAAREDFTRSLSINPRQRDVYLVCADVNTKLGNLEAAIADYESCLYFQPDDLGVYISKTLLHLDMKDKLGAIESLEHCIALDPTNANFHAVKGDLLLVIGDDLASSEYHLKKALELDPQDGQSLEYLARLYVKQKNAAALLEIIDRLIELPTKKNDLLALAYLTKAQTYKTDDNQKKLDYLNLSLLAKPSSSAYLLRGAILHSMSQIENAIADYNNVIELKNEKDIPQAIINRGEAYFALGQYQAAMSDFEQALQLDERFESAKAGLAICHWRLGDSEKAVALWRGLVASNAKYQEVLWVKDYLNWQESLVQTAQDLIRQLGS